LLALGSPFPSPPDEGIALLCVKAQCCTIIAVTARSPSLITQENTISDVQ